VAMWQSRAVALRGIDWSEGHGLAQDLALVELADAIRLFGVAHDASLASGS
jgi:hypothetical protein